MNSSFKLENEKSKSDETGTDAKLDEIVEAKVKMCTPVHGLSGFSAIDQT